MLGGSLADLRTKMQNVECPLKDTARQMVFGSGDPHNPAIMIIGEAPGQEEDIQGKPFVGRSGQLLDAMLRAIKLNREDLYITNIVPWRPPNNRTPTTEETELMLPYLTEHITLVKPAVLLLLGGTVTRALLQDDSTPMCQLTGKWYRYLDIKTIATYHPSYLLRSPGKKAETWQTLLKLRRYLNDQTQS
jgi:DNA polymerase